jgi:hypothetical protein
LFVFNFGKEHCIFDGVSFNGEGGVIYSTGGEINVTNCNFNHISGTNGGVFCCGSTILKVFYLFIYVFLFIILFIHFILFVH